MNPGGIDAAWLAAHTDISCVQAEHTRADIEALAATAARHGFVSAHVLPNRLRELRALLEGTGVLAGGPIGFPSGGTTTAVKLAEARGLLADGAQEMDIVANIGRLKSGEDAAVLAEATEVVALAEHRIPVRLIIEVSRLTADEIRRASAIAAASGADYVKTGTGWAGPTTVDHIRLIRNEIGDSILIKAAGGVRSLDTVRAMVGAGVTRFGINDAVAVELLEQLLRAPVGEPHRS